MQILQKIQRAFQKPVNPDLRFFKWALLFCLFTTVTSTPHTWAIGNIHFGSLEFHPFFNAKGGYADNIYLAPEAFKKSSAFRSYSPGLKCDWNKTKYRFQLSYLYEFFNYDNEEVDDKDLFDLDSRFNFRFGKSGNGIKLDVGYGYLKTSDPYTSEQRASDRKEKSAKFDVRLNIKDHFRIGFNSKLIQHRFMDDVLAAKWNQDVVNLFSKASIRPFTKTYILFEYGLIISDYKDPNKALHDNSKVHSLLTGLEWEATEKLSGVMKAGYQWKRYDDLNNSGDRSPGTWKAEVDLKHTFSEFTSIRLCYERIIEDSNFNYNGQDAEFYYLNRIKLDVNHKLTYKIETWIDIFYHHSSYNNVSREDEVWQFDLGLDYQFLDWIWASINYQSRIRNTDLDKYDSFDYKSNRFNIGLNLIF